MVLAIEDSLLELFQIQLNLTKYEALALIALIYRKGEATEISETSGIPRPKVYGTIELLENKKLIVKDKQGFYEPNIPNISFIKEDAENLMERYRNFIDKLYNQTVVSTNLLSQLKEKISLLLNHAGYIIEAEKKIKNSLEEKKLLSLSIVNDIPWLKSNIFEFDYIKERNRLLEKIDEVDHRLKILEQEKGKETHKQTIAREQEINHWNSLKKHFNNMLSLLNTKIAKSKFRLPDFITESPNSGLRIAIMLFTNEKEYQNSQILLSDILEVFSCNKLVIITTFDFSSFDPSLKELDHYIERRTILEIIDNVTLESLEKLSDFLKNLDLEWIELKERLTNLEIKMNNAKENCRINLMKKIELLSKERNICPEEYKIIINEIISKIKNDVNVYDQLLSQIENLIIEHFNMLNRKMLFPLEELLDMEKYLANINDKLRQKEQELLNLQDELYLISNENNPYKEFGYNLNPYSLWVPLEKPNYIINQEFPKEIVEEFINNGHSIDEKNFMIISGYQGVGKSHFINYFNDQINLGHFGKSLAIKINCKSNRDVIDLYPQIIENIKEILIDKKENNLATTISKILEEEGSPRFIQDLRKILKEIYLNLLNNGYKHFFIFIDDFENSLPPLLDYTLHESERIKRYIGTPKAILQLASITMLPNIIFIVTLRKEYLDIWIKEMREHISKIESKYLINIKTLSYEDSKKFLHFRLTTTAFKQVNENLSQFTFNDDVTRSIFENSNGNPKKMLRQAATIFRKAVLMKKINISSDLIK